MTDSWSQGALKMIWAYMVENGVLTNGKWNYYGSSWERVGGKDPFDYVGSSEAMERARKHILTIGVDWDKTQPPESSTNSCFDGTFNESSSVESLLGVLVLKDGTEYVIGVNNGDQRFHGYMKALAELAADRERMQRILGESE